MLYGGNALSVPFKAFSGILKTKGSSDLAQASTISIRGFAKYLNEHFPTYFRMDRLLKAIDEGLYFDSNIPQGYGAGSSGALVAALLHEFGQGLPEALMAKKELFGAIESYFHGSSSGLDVLVCYDACAILLNDNELQRIELPPENLLNELFVLDSRQIGITSEMVALFKKAPDTFEAAFKEVYLQSSNACIQYFLIGNKDALQKEMAVLSAFAWTHMRFTIPHNLHALWLQSMHSNEYVLKICGSGGGGFVLGLGASPSDDFIQLGSLA